MNDFAKPAAPFSSNIDFDLEDIQRKARQTLNNPQPAVEEAKSFIERNKKVIVGGIVVIVALKVNKRKVAKATAKAVVKSLEKGSKNSAVAHGTTRAASDLMVDDWFNVGGKLWRIGSKVFNDFGEPVFKLYTPGDLDNYALMVVGPKTVVETFNQ